MAYAGAGQGQVPVLAAYPRMMRGPEVDRIGLQRGPPRDLADDGSSSRTWSSSSSAQACKEQFDLNNPQKLPQYSLSKAGIVISTHSPRRAHSYNARKLNRTHQSSARGRSLSEYIRKHQRKELFNTNHGVGMWNVENNQNPWLTFENIKPWTVSSQMYGNHYHQPWSRYQVTHRNKMPREAFNRKAFNTLFEI